MPVGPHMFCAFRTVPEPVSCRFGRSNVANLLCRPALKRSAAASCLRVLWDARTVFMPPLFSCAGERAELRERINHYISFKYNI